MKREISNLRQKNMVTNPRGLGPKKDYAGEEEQHIQNKGGPLVREGAPEEQSVAM
jgi:hypothetical protein